MSDFARLPPAAAPSGDADLATASRSGDAIASVGVRRRPKVACHLSRPPQ
jgi:hypothetical protein